MNNSCQLKMQLGQSQYIIKITGSFFNGGLKGLFIDICRMIENIDKVSGPGLSYIASKAWTCGLYSKSFLFKKNKHRQKTI